MLPPLEDVNHELEEIWASQWLTNNGLKLQKLEDEIGKLLNVPNISLFNNGTIALMVAVSSLRVLGEVIATPFTFPATPHVLFWNGITPVFCDIDEKSMTIDAIKIEQMITPRTTAILGVHVYGNPCDVQKIQDIANNYGLKVIYDAAHAFHTAIDGISIGNFGDISMFSFHATKLFHTAEGEALTFKDTMLKQRIALLRNFGIKNEEEVVMLGINGLSIQLTPTEFVLLTVLVQNRDKTLTWQQIFEALELEGNDAYDVVKWHIHSLRRKIEKRSEQPELIINVRGVGYRYVPQSPEVT